MATQPSIATTTYGAITVDRSIMSPQFLGTLTSTGASINNGTSNPILNLACGASILLQGDAAFYVLCGKTAMDTVSSSNGVLVQATTEWPVTLLGSEAFICIISVTGTVNVKVWTT